MDWLAGHAAALNIIGLGMATVAAVLMFFYPRTVVVYTAKGEQAATFVGNSTAHGIRAAARQRFFSNLAIWLLFLGFLFQLAAAFMAS